MKMFAAILLATVSVSAGAQVASPSAVGIPAAGTSIRDQSGASVGKVVLATTDFIVIDTGTSQVAFGPSSFTRSNGILVIGMSRAEVEQAAQQADAAAKANVVMLLRPGTRVVDQTGHPVGQVESVNADLAVVSTPNVKAKVPTRAFIASGQNLMIAMSAPQLEAAVHQAGAPHP